jgi:predicted dehydrogenase
MAAATDVDLTGVVARAPGTVAAVRADLPGVAIYPSLTEMIAAGGIDAVTITTPPQTRRALVLEAIAAGLHVIADKPFAPDAEGARQLDQAARAKGVVLGVFHNRRWDSDIRTLRKLIGDGRLGRVWSLHSRFDLNELTTLEAGPTGGLLRDLGSHLVDQMLWLLGPVATVDAQLDMVELPQGPTDASFTLTLRHRSGVHSHLSASKLNYLVTRELRAYGDRGSYVAYGSGVQAQSIFAGKRPAADPEGWGYEPEANWGVLRTAAGEERVPAEQGRYHDYYEAFVHAVQTAGAPPVTADDGAATLAILDAARISAAERRSVNIDIEAK